MKLTRVLTLSILGNIPAEFSRLTNLKNLAMSQNDLTGGDAFDKDV